MGKTRKRITTISSSLVALGGAYTALGGNLADVARNLWSGVTTNPVAAILIIAGLAGVLYANWSDARRLFGFGRSNADWVRDIQQWTHIQRKWELIKTDSGPNSFNIAFRVPMTATASRTVNVLRESGSPTVAIVIGLTVPETQQTELAKLGNDELEDLWDDLIIELESSAVDLSMQGQGKIPIQITLASLLPVETAISDLDFMEKMTVVVQAGDKANAMLRKTTRRIKP